MVDSPGGSQHSLIAADKDRGRFSDEEEAQGAAGVAADMSALQKEPMIISRQGEAFGAIRVDLAWDRVVVEEPKGLLAAAKAVIQKEAPVDLDLGCLYELQDGTKGCLQAFGDLYGAYNKEPFIEHSGDERTGKTEGADESLRINGAHWSDIKRILIYAYIYKGAVNWNVLNCYSTLEAGGRKVKLSMDETASHLPICALMTLDNEHDQIQVTRRLEYFAGHPEMDRAYGYGMQWEEGSK